MDENGGALLSKSSVDQLNLGVFKSIDELTAAIELYVLAHNETTKPFI